ncbi:MAG: TonB-dependent receptor domain-containing protein [Chitinophagaceae bacterium]
MKLKYFIVILLIIINTSTFSQKKNIKTEKIYVYGTCEQCKDRIENTLKAIGTYKANWNIETNILTVSYDSIKLTKSAIQKRLAEVGHDSKGFYSTDNTYKKLPDCCHYDRPQKVGAIKIESSNLDSTINKIIPSINIIQSAKNDSFKIADTTINIAKNIITGIVLEEDKKGTFIPLKNVVVKNLYDNNIVTTDSFGVFKIAAELPIKLVFSYVGFNTDTINIINFDNIKVVLKTATSTTLKDVVVTSRNFSSYVASTSTLNTLNITSKELAKAACCNLSESFETSPSIDVSYADAVTGIKQIQLLGLSGNYTQITTENTPELRGLAGSFGLTFIPGAFIENIQVTKGTGSVVNGFESIAGQINIEEKKPFNAEKLLVNTYINDMQRIEGNVNYSTKLNSHLSTGLLLHSNASNLKMDKNKDGFLDMPIGRQFNGISRWHYQNEKGLVLQLSIKALNDKRIAGDKTFNENTDKLTTNKYGVGIDVEQYAATGKIGYVFPQQKYKSIGFIFSAINYQNNSYYGLKEYNGEQNSLYANLIYQSIIGTTTHKYRTGLSFVNDNFNETFNSVQYTRKEVVSGAFFEYTFSPSKSFTTIAAARVDYHNQYGYMFTPRVNIKYDFSTKTNIRLSAGSGFRTANIFAENTGLFVSSRQFNIINPTLNYGYGLNPEKAWNFGINFTHQFKINTHQGTISIDAYRTSFTNQTVVDVDANPQQIQFYNLNGKSFSNSLQVEANYEIMKKMDIRLAYRWLDVQTNYNGTMLEKPLTARHRAFINYSCETNNNWKFDITAQWLSSKRLPSTTVNPTDKQMLRHSPSYYQLAAQVTKQFGKNWDVYLGAENLTAFTQQQLIVDSQNPFGQYFDASMIWGPVNGRIIYLGMRFKIK